MALKKLSAEAAQWVEKGVLELQSHTFDLHQLAADGGRDGILPMPREERADYCTALLADARAFAQRRLDHGVDSPLVALAYPYGYFDASSMEILRGADYRMSFTVQERVNFLSVGDESCLWDMGRWNVTERDSGEALVQRLERK